MKIYTAPFELDEKSYNVGFFKPNGEIDISCLKRKEFPSKVVTSHANVLLNRGFIENFNCFYTDVQCWVANFNINDTKHEKLMFSLSKEHVSCSHIANELDMKSFANGTDNIVMCSTYINHKLGHIPLVLKLWLKKNLKHFEYSKTDMSRLNARVILNHLITLQLQFSDNGLFPWQPWTYQEGTAQKKSTLIYNKMLQTDKEFLEIKGIKDSFAWLQNYNPDWIEEFKTI